MLIRIARVGIALVAAFALTATGLAQPQRQNNRMQQMAGAMVQSMLDAQTTQANPLVLIYRKDVQRDMGLDLGQRNKFDNLNDRQTREMQQTQIQNRRNPSAVSALRSEQAKQTQDKIDELLTKEQKARLNQISMQVRGNVVLLEPDMQTRLQITDEQKLQLSEIRGQRDQRIEQLRASAQTGGVGPQELRTEFQQIQTDIDKALFDVLTDDQADAYKKIVGKPFKAG